MTCTWNGSGNPRVLLGRLGSRIREVDAGYSSACWVTNYATTAEGYARIKLRPDPSPKYVHRVVYELMVGPIPEGLHLDHLCRNPPCCNPEHLEPVTPRVNVQRGEKAQRTHCVNGHEFTPENTRTRARAAGGRDCKTCNTERARARRAKRKVAQ